MSNEKVVDFLTKRNEILEKRCGRYRDLMKEANLDLVDNLDSVNTGKISTNDARYLADIPEIAEIRADDFDGDVFCCVPVGSETASFYDCVLCDLAVELSNCINNRNRISKKLFKKWNNMIKQMRGDIRK